MSTAIGIDLNGVLDTVAHPNHKLRHAPIPPVVITDLPQGILAGEEAILSPFGRPRLAETVGHRISILELLRALELENTDPKAPRQIGQHLYSLLPKENRSCVIAVPDIPKFNERARDRLISGASQCGVNASLLWRPVAALLGWGETLNNAELRALHGKCTYVLQLLPEGIAVSELDLECVEQDAQPTLVPVRRRDGLRKLYPYSNRELTDLLADEIGITDHRLLWASAWAWNALLGRTAEPELLPDTQSPSGWRMVNGLPNLRGSLAKALSTAVNSVLQENHSKFKGASAILIEGPLAHAHLQPRLGSTVFLDFIKNKFKDYSVSLDSIFGVSTSGNLVAQGCAICAERQTKGLITYYDFLPMLEINVLQGKEYTFAPLIDVNRVEGGKTYFNTLADRFKIDKKSKKLVFYLLKEDEQEARRSETTLSVENEVKISLHVTQVPAQGYAKIEICPDVYGALGNKSILLDWSAMDIEKRTREQILSSLPIELGIGYPEILPQPAHRLIWEETSILNTIKEFNICSVHEYQYDNLISKQHEKTLGRIGTRSSPFFLTRNNIDQGDIDQDEDIYTAVDSEGHLPNGVSLEIIEEFNKFHEKLGRDFVKANARTRIEQLARLGATLYRSCPEAIVGYYRRVATPNGPSPRLIFYAGRIFCSEADLTRLFEYCNRRYHDAHRDGTPLSWYVIKAVGDALAFQEQAGEILDPKLADSIADAMLYVLKNEVNKRKFKNPFKVVIRLSAFLLRHRMHPNHRDFLYPKSLNTRNNQRAKELLELLEEASNLGAFNKDKKLKKNADQIREHILYQGTNSIIVIGPIDDEG